MRTGDRGAYWIAVLTRTRICRQCVNQQKSHSHIILTSEPVISHGFHREYAILVLYWIIFSFEPVTDVVSFGRRIITSNKSDIFHDISLTVLILTASTSLGVLFRMLDFHETNVVVVFIFSVLLISRMTRGYAYGICSSVISLLLFNWFFTKPYYTLKVNDMTYFITFAIMTFTSIMTSALTTKEKQAAAEAYEREYESNALYQMTNRLTDAEDAAEIADITVKTSSDVLNCNTACICFDENGVPEKTLIQHKSDGTLVRREPTAAEEPGRNGAADTSDSDCQYPIYGKSMVLAVLLVPRDTCSTMSASQTRMLHSIIESAALALERLRSLQAQAKSREEATQERYRSNLLRAISHDIRTPLSGIMGTSEMLMDKLKEENSDYILAQDIYQDAEWLHNLVENILNLTKLRDGKLVLDKKPEAIEEVIGAALMVMEKRIPDRVIDVDIPDEVIMVPMDAKLISQVLVNLLDNASKHTPKDREILISVYTDDEKASIAVADRGTGISEQDLPQLFQMFYTTRSKDSDSRHGVGLGLAICQSIVEAHKGTINAQNRSGGGAVFTFTLPLESD